MGSTRWDVDGRRVFGVTAGSGEPVLLLHGYPQSASCWRHQIPALADGHHVVMEERPREVTDALVSLLNMAPAANP